ncbi:MAG: alkaline phosphatase family protein [Candidatus Thermoplasmatota archaeon]|nr:alkaline phosphatase family protein [Candidatus Thermoplasmatota archaeon]MCL5929826.1 alkaline phosphatase family protein [Candidatus Thermoplasmatota archaeon]
MKVVVIGIDGATWDPILPYIEKNMLPGYSKFWNEGLHGALISTIPYITQPGWKAYSMGKNPGKMGVYFWSRIDWKNFAIKNINSLGFDGKDYWDILSEKKYTVAIIDMPSTYPPKKVNGVMLSGFPKGDGTWVYPENFQDQIPQDYVKDSIHLFTKDEDPEVTMSGIEKDIKSRFDMAERLWDHDLVHISVVMNDHVSHFMWNNERIMFRNFQANDAGIMRILEKNKDGITILMSDHGNGPIEDEFYANEYLAKEGLLVKNDRKSPILSREAIVSIGKKTGLYKVARNLPNNLQEKIVKRVQQFDSDMETSSLDQLINWKKSKVIALDEGLFYINPMFYEEKEEILEELGKKLKAIKSKSGRPLYNKVLAGTEIYWGPHISDAPDVVAITNDIYHQRYQLSGYMWASDIPEKKMGFRTRQVGHHRIRGIFGMVGPGIEPKQMDASIYDLAPTILKLFGCDIPDDMDGKPLI